jgi:hypothetical protein
MHRNSTVTHALLAEADIDFSLATRSRLSQLMLHPRKEKPGREARRALNFHDGG